MKNLKLTEQSSKINIIAYIFIETSLNFKNNTNTVTTNPRFRYEGKTEEDRNLVTFKDTPLNNLINGKLSTRPLD